MLGCQYRKRDREIEKELTDLHKDREKMGLIDLDARAAVRSGPDGRDGGLEDKLPSDCDRMRMRVRQAASVCVLVCVPKYQCMCALCSNTLPLAGATTRTHKCSKTRWFVCVCVCVCVSVCV